MISRPHSAEQWLQEVSEIIRTYRSADGRFPSARQIAIKKLKDLGLTEGDALRYLSKPDVQSDNSAQPVWRVNRPGP